MAPKKGSHTNPSGLDKTSKRSRTSLAAKARELLHDGDLTLKFYEIIAGGGKPEFIYAEDKTTVIGVKKKEVGSYDNQPVTLDQQMLAMARITERGYGQAAQHQIIEHEVTAEITAITNGVDTRYLQKLSPEALLTIRNAVKQLEAPKPEEDPAVEDAEFEDVTDTDGQIGDDTPSNQTEEES